ncbi:MAG: monofunctional biosynthetic peptidoglycan transglycosylase [Bacteroidales bacterium]
MKLILRWLKRLIILFFLSSIGITLLYRFIPVFVTPLMLIRTIQQIGKGEPVVCHHQWVSLNRINSYLPLAVVASEDNLFMQHHGFDLNAIKQAVHENKKRKRPRGASTISQQTAKNVFLWPRSSWLRKGLEVYFTVLIEFLWGKERIMEVYLNSMETGYGLYGAQAVARYHFDTTAEKLTKKQCAIIAATLPNPLRYNSAKPSAYILRRQNQIMSLMNKIVPVKFD